MTKKFETTFIIEATKTGGRFTIGWDNVMPYWIIGQIVLLLLGK
jgi:hypothetical protein